MSKEVSMSDKKQPTKEQEKLVYLVHLDSGVVSVEATSLKEAVEIAKKMNKESDDV